MNVGILGLGLIGGSLAKAYKAEGHTVFAAETDAAILDFALLSGAADAPLDEGTLGRCELILLAVYPRAAIEFLDVSGRCISPGSVVIDCCGTKKNICDAGFSSARRNGFSFVGGHPMAGTERSGFKYSKATMFKGATMILVPESYDAIEFFERLKELLAPAKFGKITITTAEKHDAMIAFTSQLAHLASNAFIKSPTATEHRGFSAGSYQDLTRVAWLNEEMWAELFLENKEHLLFELDLFIAALGQYRQAIETEDFDALRALLYEGKRLKEEVDR